MGPGLFRIKTLPNRLKESVDLFKPVLDKEINLLTFQ